MNRKLIHKIKQMLQLTKQGIKSKDTISMTSSFKF